jgi:hypothetical protein
MAPLCVNDMIKRKLTARRERDGILGTHAPSLGINWIT